MGVGPSDDVTSSTVLAIVWGAYETLHWYFERHPSARPRTVLLLDPVGNEEAARLAVPGKGGRIDCINAIPSERDGDTEVFSYTQPGLFSVQPTTPALRALFPGLRTRNVLTAAHVSAKKLLASLGGESEKLSLVLEAPGAELSVLEYIENAGFLERLSAIHLRCGAGVFFENAADEATLVDWLRSRFFQVVARNDEDVDWPQLAFEPDVNARRLPELEMRIHALEQVIAERDADIEGARAARQGLEKAVSERDAAAEETRAALQQLEKTLSERDADLEMVRTACQRLEADVDEAQAGRMQLEKALDEARGQANADKATIAERDATLNKAQAERDAILKTVQAEREQFDKALKSELARVESHKAATSRLQNRLNENEEALARAVGDSARAREDVSEMLKSLRMAQADLTDLRERYALLHDEKARLEQLIQKLTPRLQEAAGQLKDLFVSPSGKPASIERSRRKKTGKEGK